MPPDAQTPLLPLEKGPFAPSTRSAAALQAGVDYPECGRKNRGQNKWASRRQCGQELEVEVTTSPMVREDKTARSRPMTAVTAKVLKLCSALIWSLTPQTQHHTNSPVNYVGPADCRPTKTGRQSLADEVPTTSTLLLHFWKEAPRERGPSTLIMHYIYICMYVYVCIYSA